MHGWFRDARYAIRQLRRAPTFTLTAILTLALGIGAIGILGSLALTPLLRSQLYGVASNDPVTYVCVACAMGAVVLTACLLPARRAAQVEPIRVLRYE